MTNSTLKENSELVLKLSLPTFILLGLAKTNAYYNQFHLPILEYLSFSEMITIFLNNIYVYAALFFHLGIFFFLDKNHFRGSLTLISIAFIFISVFNGLSGNFRFDTSNTLIVVTGIILIAAILIGISKRSIETYLATFDKTTKKLFAAVFTLLALLIISSFQGKFEAAQVKKEHIYSQTSIKNKTGNIVSNDTTYFIGKTNDYIFFYNGVEKSVQVYPMNEIEEIIYKTKTKY